ncbi:LysM peptidoglycan-binding domain-containing protein [Ectothiorhodospira mobilis]|uniref:LysM peptidoglycan-binding domain-containing protein n=1 Tax=Ectothiorhodospira mobilis TaxID=195064 RepID=UPI0019071BF6|nr:LysM domain-containing protein [Ectothiorhodospira mobilis]MBK1692379.1 peptidoglycan-binding protein [Ectothiorhodospira mobilis]
MSAPFPPRAGSAASIVTLILALLATGCATAPRDPAPEQTPATAERAPEAAPASPKEAPTPARARVRDTAPERYVVRPGDTLWDISTTFLETPWYWPEIWVDNPQIENPHLIYPGDVITLHYVNGRPRLMVDGGPRVRPTVKLSPRVRAEPLPPSLDTPVQALQQFLIRPRVVTEKQMEDSPYLLASRDERMIFGAGDRLYARGLEGDPVGSRYHVFRPGGELRDPETGERLGFEAIPVAGAELVRGGDPATVVLTRSDREALQGDRLLPQDDSAQDFLFTPRPPHPDAHGQVISLFDAISRIARFQVAVINLGERDDVEQGQVFAVHHSGRTVRDRIAGGERVTLPDERAGLLMVFRTFDKVSYALVVESTHPIAQGNTVRHP